ncbi:MAG TPA: hypothetical protein PLU47_14330, partial [Azonexus sp.]|nr:hypothetical protein [Azonexus sp.]
FSAQTPRNPGTFQCASTAAREHAKHKARYRKSIKKTADALDGMARAKGQATTNTGSEARALPAIQTATLEGYESDTTPLITPLEKAPDPTAPDDELMADFRAWREAESKKPSPYFQD